MEDGSKLTLENVAQLDKASTSTKQRRTSVVTSSTTQQSSSELRRLSRVDPGTGAGGRRLSTFSRQSLAGLLWHRPSKVEGILQTGLPKKLQNTYKLGPDPYERFNADRVERVMKQILDSYLRGHSYNPVGAAQLSKTLTEVIKGKVKEMSFPRYKIICLVLIGQKLGQGLEVASRSIWNTDTDNYASATFENHSLFAVASVYATYFE